MITITRRHPSGTELELLKKQRPGIYTRIAHFSLLVIAFLIPQLLLLLIYGKFHPVSSIAQALWSLTIIAVAVTLAILFTKKINSTVGYPGKNCHEVEVFQVQTGRAVCREDYEDFGIAYYIAVTHNGQPKTLYLWGQYLYDFDDHTFPNTVFEYTRYAGNDTFISFTTTGQYLAPESTLPPFDKKVWDSGNFPINGQLLDQSIDEILSAVPCPLSL